MEYTAGASSWRKALRRAASVLMPRRVADRHLGWSALVPVVALLAGLLFTTSATTARGTDLRNDRRPELRGLIEQRRKQVEAAEHEAGTLRADIDSRTRALSGSDAGIAAERARADQLKGAAGLEAVHGPGITVRLDDAPRRPDGSLPPGASPDDVVVHQQDVQAVVNALWAGGAEAMSIMNVRVISTSAVRCVGNTLLLEGQVFSPPFVVTAIGDPAALRAALDASTGVQAFREAAADFGLGYDVRTEPDVAVPAYQGSTSLRYAQAGAGG
ncbi:MAG TPA: DUF881 domain-containing protein [Micromonosporaceae bacterium]